jgi:thiamine kinase-like enzyme
LIIPPCYAAVYDETSGASYLLLHDLSETHAAPDTREQQISMVDAVPAAAHIEAVVDTLARLHAYWWQHPLLEKGRFEVGYWTSNAERFAMYLQRRKTSWDDLLAQEGSWFPGDLRELYEQVFEHLPGYWQRHLASRFRTKTNLTLIHGDAYFSNFLYPKQPGAGPTYLLDWQSPTFDLAGYDLVNLIATFWTPARRQEDGREQKILRRYYAALQTYGVQHYSWEELLTDYKHGLIFWLLMPVQDRYGGAGKSYWWPKMQCLVGAFRDWDSQEMLGM